MKRNISFTWSNPGSEIEYHISGVILPGRPGTRHGFDRFAEPDEPDEFQFVSATMVIGGKVFGESDFSEAEMEGIEAAAFESYDGEDCEDIF